MTDNNVQVNAKTGIDGNAYTSSISNDQLTNEDFLQLMITELQLQDPTKPMDSQQMLATQMQMSTIQTNLEMSKAMTGLQASLANMTLSNAINFQGKKVDAIVDMPAKDSAGNIRKDGNGNTITEKVQASFFINTVKIEDGKTYFESKELVGFKDRLANQETNEIVNYDYETGQIKDSEGKGTDYYIKLDKDGMFDMNNGAISIVDKDGKTVTPPKYTPEGESDSKFKYAFLRTDEIYSPNNTNIEYGQITKVY